MRSIADLPSNAYDVGRSLASGIEPYTGPWGEKQVLHLLRRTLFGPQVDQINMFKEMTMDEAVDRLLETEQDPQPPLNHYNDEEIKDPEVPLGETWIDSYTREDSDITGARVVSLKTWWINNVLNQGPSLHEKVIFFWHNHLATQSWDVFWPNLTYHHFEMLRRHAFGNFKDLIKEVTLDPHMLLYLNGALNREEAPDENYARELQELFCIGKGAGAKFTEGDVQAAARVLTGHSIDWDDKGKYLFRPYWHDAGDKQFSEFYDGAVIKGREGEDGKEEYEELISILFKTSELPRFIARKLYRFFVYSDIDDETERLVIEPLAEIFSNNNYEIKPVLSVLFRSAHFFDEANRGAMIKSPLDFLIGLWRTGGILMPEEASPVNEHEIRSNMLWSMGTQGLEVLDPPNVAGYPAYYQFPQYDKSWITTNTITNRALMTDSFVYWGFWSRNLRTNLDILAHLKALDHPEDPIKLVDEICIKHLAYDPDASIKSRMVGILLSGQQNNAYWTNAWYEYLDAPNDEMKKNTVELRLKVMFQFLFQLSEYHLV
ncbi:MAG: DUF1800 domain-containing protein [Saprospiraceae bacterium]|nr:DUF1800 domain-containing protein [Saprospiraceae bacterium]